MEVKLEQLVTVVVRCFLIYLMLVTGFNYVMIFANLIAQSISTETVFYMLLSLVIYAVLVFALYKAPLLARLIVPQSNTTVNVSISPAQIEVILLRVIGVWLAAESIAQSARWIAGVGLSSTHGIFVDLRLAGYAAQTLVGIALAFGAQGLSNLIRKVRGREQ